MRKDKILFLHGMNSKPWEDRMEIMRATGVEVVGPHIDYMDVDGWEVTKNLIEVEKGFTMVVGHSFGGVICSYLTDFYSIPSLMFNPAYHPVNTEYFDNRVDMTKASRGGKVYYAVVGMRDTVVNPFGQMAALKKKGEPPLVRVFQEPDLGHKVDPATFKKYFDIFYADNRIPPPREPGAAE